MRLGMTKKAEDNFFVLVIAKNDLFVEFQLPADDEVYASLFIDIMNDINLGKINDEKCKEAKEAREKIKEHGTENSTDTERSDEKTS